MISYSIHLPAVENKAEQLWELVQVNYPGAQREVLRFAERDDLREFVRSCYADPACLVYEDGRKKQINKRENMEKIKLSKAWEIKPGVTVEKGSTVKVTLQRAEALRAAGMVQDEKKSTNTKIDK